MGIKTAITDNYEEDSHLVVVGEQVMQSEGI